MKKLSRGPMGNIKGTIGNVMLYLANEWLGYLGYDRFAHAPVWLQEPKWDATERPSKRCQVGQDLEDEDAGRVQAWLGRRGCDVNYDTAFRALDLAAQNNSFHPILDRLQMVDWDGIPRVDRFYAEYFGTTDTPYTRLVSRIQLVSSIARLVKPGCKVDTMVILEGAQGLKGSDDQDSDGMLGKGKSSAFKALYGAKYFTDHISDLGTKDAFQELRAIWCGEMAELDTLTKVDANQAKRFISSSVDKYRESYGRRVKAYPRQCVLVGSINPDGDLGYLKDQTGARRFLPITVTRCEVKRIGDDADQIWAEAIHMFHNGTKWWATKDEEAILEVEQDKRRQVDPWEDIIARFVARFDHPTVTGTYVLANAIKLTPEKMAGYNLSRVGSVMKRLGWESGRVERNGTTHRFYWRSDTEHFELKPKYRLDPLYEDASGGLSDDDLDDIGRDTGTPETAPRQDTHVGGMGRTVITTIGKHDSIETVDTSPPATIDMESDDPNDDFDNDYDSDSEYDRHRRESWGRDDV